MLVIDTIDDFTKNVIQYTGRPIVCGGAIRDYALGKPIGDIDMYVGRGFASTIKNKLTKNAIAYMTKSQAGPISYKKMNKSIDEVISFNYNGFDFDLIFCGSTSHLSIWTTYDNNLCKFAYDPVSRMCHVAPEALNDSSMKTITKNPSVSEDCWKHSKKKHIPKMLAKYSGFRVIEDGKDITHEFSSLPSQQWQTYKPTPTPTPTKYARVDATVRVENGGDPVMQIPKIQDDLFCSCSPDQRNIVPNTAYGALFLYCKTCCKEYKKPETSLFGDGDFF